MAAKQKHYMSRTKDGREQSYDAPDIFLTKAYQYFAWCDNNPLLKKEAIKSGTMVGTLVDVPLQRPYTLAGLCVYCGISEQTLTEWEVQEDFNSVISHLKAVITQNQLEGAASGIYNASMIARLLDFTDKDQFGTVSGQSFVISVINSKTKEEIDNLKQKLTLNI